MNAPIPLLVGRVLVVEDHPVNQQVLAFQLEELGLSFDLADDGRAALERLAAAHYDLVLMDWQMPGMDGDEATRRIRATPALAGLPVIALTANTGDDYRAACLAAGASDYLGKPYDEDQLAALLAHWLTPGGTRARRPELFDRAALAERYPGNPALLEQIAALFRATSLESLAVLRDRIAARDALQTAREAHKLRGGAASVLAADVQRVAGEMEAAAKESECDWPRIEAGLAELSVLFA